MFRCFVAVVVVVALLQSVYAQDPTKIKYVHVVFSNHFDAGYNAHVSPQKGLAIDVINSYFDDHFPQAVTIAKEMRATTKHRYVWMTQAWLVSLYVNCPTNGSFPGELHCPTEEQRDAFISTIKQGDITYHAFPFNGELSVLSPEMLKFGVKLVHDLDDMFGIPRSTVISQRDVPGVTAGSIDILKTVGVDAVSVGCNGAAAPPVVPKVFMWNPPSAEQEIIAMWHPGGYGGITLKDCVYFDGFDHALALSWRGDNSGPAINTKEVLDVYATLEQEFPNATIKASTFTEFVNELKSATHLLPVVTTEIADTWIHGIGSDPLKTAQFRAAEREIETCIASRQCDYSDKRFYDFMRLLIKCSEHTWGMDVKTFLRDTTTWSVQDLHGNLTKPNFKLIVESWVEQREYIYKGIEVLGDHPLASKIKRSFSELEASVPSTIGFTKISDFVGKTYTCGNNRFSVGFNEQGAMSHLVDSKNANIEIASQSNTLGSFAYQGYTTQDFTDFLSGYINCDFHTTCTWAYLDYGKPGMDAGNPKHQTVSPSTSEIYLRQTQSSCEFLVPMIMPHDAVTYYGSPATLWSTVEVSENEISWSLDWFQKTSCRMGEGLFFSFDPVVDKSEKVFVGKLLSEVNAENVVKNASQHLHAQWSGVTVKTDKLGLKFESTDAPLVSIGLLSAFPTPVVNPPTLSGGIHFVLEDNIWGTNYPMWYPFVEKDANARYRFSMTIL